MLTLLLLVSFFFLHSAYMIKILEGAWMCLPHHKFSRGLCVCLFFYHREHPLMWGVEVSSGHGPREVRTSLQLSNRPLVDHIIIETGHLYVPVQI